MNTERFDFATQRELEQSCTYRFLALLFQPPSPEMARELADLAGVLDESLREDGRALAFELGPDVEHDYHALLGGSGRCRDCESDYQVAALGGKGPLLADVAAFYRAFHFAADDHCLAPDHVAVELDFLGYLAMKAAYARHASLIDEREICELAAEQFDRDHVARWLPSFLAQVMSAAGDSFYGRAARFAERAASVPGKAQLPW
jgi:TorA maturation chaperone TorD